MRPAPFVQLLRQWVVDRDPPAFKTVRTTADIGRLDQPFGLALTLGAEWTAVVQVVATSPPHGDTSLPVLPDEDAYQAAAVRFAVEQSQAQKTRSGRPPVGENDILEALHDAVKNAGHHDVTEARVAWSEGYTNPHRSLAIGCADGYRLYAFVAGFLPPGAVKLSHPTRDFPKEWR